MGVRTPRPYHQGSRRKTRGPPTTPLPPSQLPVDLTLFFKTRETQPPTEFSTRTHTCSWRCCPSFLCKVPVAGAATLRPCTPPFTPHLPQPPRTPRRLFLCPNWRGPLPSLRGRAWALSVPSTFLTLHSELGARRPCLKVGLYKCRENMRKSFGQNGIKITHVKIHRVGVYDKNLENCKQTGIPLIQEVSAQDKRAQVTLGGVAEAS